MLLTGDSETDERRWWLVNHPELVRDCTILKLAHHGSRNGTDARWLNLVSPELAVASLGRNNDYGHPHSETISLLRRNEIPLLRTDQRGTISIVSDGQTWNLVNTQLARRQESDDSDHVAASSMAGRRRLEHPSRAPAGSEPGRLAFGAGRRPTPDPVESAIRLRSFILALKLRDQRQCHKQDSESSGQA